MTRWPGNAWRQKTSFGGLNRAQLMSRVKGYRNATTELRFISLLKSTAITGWRRNSQLQGHPDFVFPARRIAVFLDGCFWHGHNCGRNLMPKSNRKQWITKISNNRSRDRMNNRHLSSIGWTVVRIWECELSKRPQVVISKLSKLQHGS